MLTRLFNKRRLLNNSIPFTDCYNKTATRLYASVAVSFIKIFNLLFDDAAN
jgi:hypothetical protein